MLAGRSCARPQLSAVRLPLQSSAGKRMKGAHRLQCPARFRSQSGPEMPTPNIAHGHLQGVCTCGPLQLPRRQGLGRLPEQPLPHCRDSRCPQCAFRKQVPSARHPHAPNTSQLSHPEEHMYALALLRLALRSGQRPGSPPLRTGALHRRQRQLWTNSQASHMSPCPNK